MPPPGSCRKGLFGAPIRSVPEEGLSRWRRTTLILPGQTSHATPAWRPGALALKAREPRRKVMIKARMRAGASWSDACILNMSSRGMLVHAPTAPARGAYLELRRGGYVIVARVVWANDNRFGVQTQDVVPADDLIRNPDGAGQSIAPQQSGFVERRAAPRQRHEASRWRARAVEFGTFALLGGVAATLMLGAMSEVLAHPMELVETALSKG